MYEPMMKLKKRGSDVVPSTRPVSGAEFVSARVTHRTTAEKAEVPRRERPALARSSRKFLGIPELLVLLSVSLPESFSFKRCFHCFGFLSELESIEGIIMLLPKTCKLSCSTLRKSFARLALALGKPV